MMHRNIEELGESERLGFQALAARGLEIPLDEAGRTRWQDQFNSIPGVEYMGCVLDLSHERVVRVHLPEIRPHHQGGLGTEAVNGAVLAGLCDCGLGVAGILHFGGRQAGTVELAMKFLRPTVGATVTAYAVALKKSTAMAFTEIEIYSAKRLCAIATGVVATTSPAE